MSENTCRTCKHWNQNVQQSPFVGRCLASLDIPHPDDNDRAMAWNYAKHDLQGLGDGQPKLVSVMVPALVYTGPDFGCIHHKPKPSEPLQQ